MTPRSLVPISQLLWIDQFNIVQCSLVCLSIVESVIVHVLLKTQRDRLAMSMDRVLRRTIPWVIYPLVTGATILWGLEEASLCPHSALCGIGHTEPAFIRRAETTGMWITFSDLAPCRSRGAPFVANSSSLQKWPAECFPLSRPL